MADDKDTISFLLDLDVKSFTESGLQAQGVIEKIGSSDSMSGLLEGLTSVGVVLGTAGLAAFAFKKALDFTTEGEDIERVSNEFNLLAQNAGIAPEKLKAGLVDAAKGLVDTNDLIKIANGSIVKMGASADQLPAIMEIARKSVSVYGGDAKTNFEAISEAIANGNTRALKHYGIIVDSTAAVRQFADANGTSADVLSDVGKRQAILNAALDAGNKAFKDVKENAQSATTILQTLKTTFSEIGATFTLAFEKTIGPGIRSFLGSVQQLATSLKLHVQASIGDGAEQAAARAILAGKSIDTISQKETQAAQTSIALSGQVTGQRFIDLEKQQKQHADYIKALSQIDATYYKEQQTNVQSLAQVDALAKQRSLALEQQHTVQLNAIANNKALTHKQRETLAAAETRNFQEQMRSDERDTAALRTTLLDNYVKNSQTAWAGISRSFQANSLKMKQEQADFGKRGNEMWNSLSTNATSAFTNMGSQMAQGKDIASATADAMRGFFLGFLGDRAIAEGSVMLLASIWPPNPLGLAGGAALLTLGGALKSLAGAGSAGATLPSSPSVAASASGAAAPIVDTSSGSSSGDTSQATSNMADQQRVQRSVQVNIAGNYLETDQTKRMLMDLMRQETDATGFAYNQIGA